MVSLKQIAETAVDCACLTGLLILSFEINRQLLLKALNTLFAPPKDFFECDKTDSEESGPEDDEIEFEDAPPPYSEIVNDSVSGN